MTNKWPAYPCTANFPVNLHLLLDCGYYRSISLSAVHAGAGTGETPAGQGRARGAMPGRGGSKGGGAVGRVDIRQ